MSLTISEAIGAFERAFRVRNPNEIERILRENLNVQVAVIESIESAENKINEGYYPLTIKVPYGVFVSKVKKDKKEGKRYVVGEAGSHLVLQNRCEDLLPHLYLSLL